MRRPNSYSWALGVDPRIPLSEAAYEGLEYAKELAVDAQRRIRQLLDHEEIWPSPLTIEEIADEAEVSVAYVARRIALARRALYGEITDSAIRHRRRRERQLRERPLRICAHRGCKTQLPWNASAARSYCDDHCTAAARTARHRRAKSRLPE